jgi:hypothetical protein
MFEEARMGNAFNSSGAQRLVDEIADSVSRNPGALISLARLTSRCSVHASGGSHGYRGTLRRLDLQADGRRGLCSRRDADADNTRGWVFVDARGLALLNHGLSLDARQLKPAIVEWLNDDQLRFVLREGRKRQIRRMCELVALRVTGLKRVRIGTVRIGDLPLEQWRFLRPVPEREKLPASVHRFRLQCHERPALQLSTACASVRLWRRLQPA